VKLLLTQEGTIEALKVKTCRTEMMADHKWVALREKDKPEKMETHEGDDLKDMGISTIMLYLANNIPRKVLGLTDPVDI